MPRAPAVEEMELADGTKILAGPVVRAIPKVPARGLSSEQAVAAKVRYDAFVRIVNMCEQNPEKAVELLNVARATNLAGASPQKNGADEAQWAPTTKTFLKLPPEYRAQCLSRWGGEEWTKERLNEMALQSAHITDCVFYCVTGMNPSDHFPPCMLDKSVCIRVLDARYSMLGKRLANMTLYMIEQGVDWWTSGPYRVEWSDSGEAVCITHVYTNTTVEVPSYSKFNKKFELMNGFSEKDAKVRKDKVVFRLLDLFRPGTGPHLCICDRQSLLELATKHRSCAEAQENAIKKHQLSMESDFLESSKEVRRKRAAQAARAQLDLKRSRCALTADVSTGAPAALTDE